MKQNTKRVVVKIEKINKHTKKNYFEQNYAFALFKKNLGSIFRMFANTTSCFNNAI